MERIALKVQRRRYAREAMDELAVYQLLRDTGELCPDIIRLREAFIYDGHICLAFDRHGNSLCEALERGAIRPARVRRAGRQILNALDHLHRAGYTHTDIKPDNILYLPRSGDARLADLGDAERRLEQGTIYGTREYTPPEMILGAPLTPAIDIWSFGCTVFEMLTDRLLFDPRAAAAKKYREFSSSGKPLPLSASALEDNAEEEAEQLDRGTIVAEKYRLEQALGRGRFGTVWTAVQLSDASLDRSREILGGGARDIIPPRKTRTPREHEDRRWRHKKGADDLVDLALNYEQVILTNALCGAFPQTMIESARFRASYFDKDGVLRFQPTVARASLRDRLRRSSILRRNALERATDFLKHCLTIDPAKRFTPAAALAHPWMAGA
jgi:serine/threonine protein kinase